MKHIHKISIASMATLLLGAGILHFVHFSFFKALVPRYLPWPSFLVYATGILELVLGILLLFRFSRKTAARFVVLLFCIYLLVHVQMAFFPAQYAGTEADISTVAAWIRLLLQFPLIAWAWSLTRDN